MAEHEGQHDPEQSGSDRSKKHDSGSERPGKRFRAGVAEGIGQAVGVALAGLVITGLTVGLIPGMQNGPHPEGGAAPAYCSNGLVI
ncbi:hypothetical protein [Streptomyces hydrogenans]|uniref:hypothetical protein n=1 Tax=Streptomyces hydrogenans TaxID=1873719 RepID=UPI0035E0EA6D